MSNYEELSLNALEGVTGGKSAPINTGDSQNAGIWKKWESIGIRKADDSLENGTMVNIVSAPRFHEVKNRNYVQITYMVRGKPGQGWVAASIVGLKR